MEAIDRHIEETFAESSSEWLQSFSGMLPYRLGLSPRGDARWSDVVRLAPNRDLPSWIDDDDGSRGALSAERVAAFDRAHHLAVAWGLVADRMDEGLVARPDEFLAVRRALFDQWSEALEQACGDQIVAHGMINGSLRERADALAIERRSPRSDRGAEGVRARAEAARKRLRWITASAAAMLVTAGQRGRVAELREVYETFLGALSEGDEPEDGWVRGGGAHALLAHPEERTARAASGALRGAAVAATSAGFRRLGRWIEGCAESEEERGEGRAERRGGGYRERASVVT